MRAIRAQIDNDPLCPIAVLRQHHVIAPRLDLHMNRSARPRPRRDGTLRSQNLDLNASEGDIPLVADVTKEHDAGTLLRVKLLFGQRNVAGIRTAALYLKRKLALLEIGVLRRNILLYFARRLQLLNVHSLLKASDQIAVRPGKLADHHLILPRKSSFFSARRQMIKALCIGSSCGWWADCP